VPAVEDLAVEQEDRLSEAASLDVRLHERVLLAGHGREQFADGVLLEHLLGGGRHRRLLVPLALPPL
jgi:hypothetical protein